MFPNVCHVHYPALTEILRATAQEYGLKYTEHKSLRSAFIAHLKWIYILGREDRDVLEDAK
jgi:linoleoyl-CoA desaturase